MAGKITRREGMALTAGAALAASLPLPAIPAPAPAPAPAPVPAPARRFVCPLADVLLEDKRLNLPAYRMISGNSMKTGKITERVASLIGWSIEDVNAAWEDPGPGDLLAYRDRFCTNLLTQMADRHDPIHPADPDRKPFVGRPAGGGIILGTIYVVNVLPAPTSAAKVKGGAA